MKLSRAELKILNEKNPSQDQAKSEFERKTKSILSFLGRRDFLRRGLLATAGLGLTLSSRSAQAAASAATAQDAGLPVLQCFTDAHSAQFRVVLDDPDLPLEIRAYDPEGRELPLRILSRSYNPFDSKLAILHFIVEGLVPGFDYDLKFIDPAEKVTFDQRKFRALDLNGRSCRFAFLSCMNDFFAGKQIDMWHALARSRPDVIFLIGDTCYTDLGSDGSAKDLWRRHFETRMMLDHFKWKRLIPTLAIWDDHDFGGNNFDSTSELRSVAFQCFNALFESEPRIGLEKGPGVSKLFRFRGQRFFLMDSRYFRDPPGQPGASHWGQEQETWLFAKLKENSEPAWLLNGSMYFGEYMGKDSFAQKHPEQLRRVLSSLRNVSSPVIFCSGDVHFSEIMEIESNVLGYKTFELVSSSMHSFTFPYHQYRFRNPRRVASTWNHNFMIVDSLAVGMNHLEARVRSVGSGGEVYFDHKIQVKK